ncbi:MAG: toxin-antitoxin system YwqK family antitoxin [Bdellovibrionales bacterium]|nr:toxin-antitoxin system YwqK family antitoxin [Bdellovibrionales bacterium]
MSSFHKDSWSACAHRSAFMLSLSLALFSLGCKDGGAEFRRVLRSAAHAPTGDATQEKAKRKSKGKAGTDASGAQENSKQVKGGIESCPKSARLVGAPYPKGLAQWCAATSKDGKELRHGEYRRWHKNGNLRQVASYKFGKFDGAVESFYPGGARKELVTYAEGVRHGPWQQWNKDGSQKVSGFFQEGRKHGAFVWFSRGGRLKERGFFEQDVKSGEWITYHRNGQVRAVSAWQGGKKHGRDEEYSKDGMILSRGHFEDNLPSGPWIEYFKNGRAKQQGVYVAGQKHGNWVDYTPEGGVRKLVVYDRGAVVRSERGQSSAKRSRKSRKGGSFGKGDILGAPPPVPTRQAATPTIPMVPEDLEEGEDEEAEWNELPSSRKAGWEKL